MKKKHLYIIVALIAGYIGAQMIADIGATKLIQIGNMVAPAATITFALTFTIRDYIHKRLGKQWAQAVIIAAAAINILQSGILYAISKMASPEYYPFTEAWAGIFEIIPSIAIASIVAEVVSELIDTEIYQLIWDKIPQAPQWVRVLGSNTIALPIDSLVFSSLAYVLLPRIFGGEILPFTVALGLTVGQIAIKMFATLICLPVVGLTKAEPLLIDSK